MGDRRRRGKKRGSVGDRRRRGKKRVVYGGVGKLRVVW